ncbi:TPA: patatin-like phospholipase family protein [Legionella pneumophila]|uniref:patatin-like phospholipase family protein n=2 Tax=Legionella pneumophila TaxID=446 RepID=UPI00058DAE14|nr:patatin-like phospholipase family protein [Legionella pneumophila]MDC8030784.1 alpha/beta hydrolase [Legionella pneumophila subsp. pneumophila]MDW8870688.1 patatin-like phospholipase family protein [Legionella pneumophila]MDW8916660.1 patatin-like phospholipase family protein [Legionella pneumophila]MDW8926207.1 patatin-like phospholipase family protein [Legionella pneumophila]MDW8932282.1 patatin-like phospholipase family protein [Legionella pneumophila]
MAKDTKMINLALQGGGAHGALAWGIIDRLLEDGRINFDAISATSAGAMNAAVLAYGFATGGKEGAREALYQFWKMVSDAGQIYNPLKKTPLEELLGIGIENSMSFFIFDLMTKILSPYQFNPLNFNPLKEILEKIVDFEKIKSCKSIKIFISATNVRTGKINVFDNKKISADAVMASACLPFMFQAVNIGEDYFWDGGYMGNPAIFPLIYNSECRDILILHINPIYREHVPDTAAEILNRVNEISFNSSLMREMRAIAFVTKLIDSGWIKDEYKNNLRKLYLHAIRADVSMESASVASKLNPEWSFISHLYEEGRKKGEEWLKSNFKHLGKVTTIDLDEYL